MTAAAAIPVEQHTPLIERSQLVSLVNQSITWAQLERGAMDVSYAVVESPPLVVSLRTANLAFQVEGALQPGRTSVAVVDSARPGARWAGRELGLAGVASARELDLRTTGASTIMAIAVDENALHAQLADCPDAAELLGGLKRSGVLSNPLAANRLRSAVRSVCSGKPPPARSIIGTLVPLLSAVLAETDFHSVERNDAAHRRFTAVRVCERYMRENLDRSVTILDLSRACSMPSRTLINAFEAITGFSPMDYLKRLRLSAVNQTLRRSGKSVTRVSDVATDWGFWHMGHFARDYRAMFGESPSQTLRFALFG